jgi:hypothetical protein
MILGDSVRDFIISGWEWQEECLTTYGNAGYEILKSIESLSKTYLTEISDPLLAGSDGPYSRMIDKVRDKEKALRQQGDHSTFQADKLSTILSGTRDPRTIIELFGMQKATGHPIVDPIKGGRSSAEAALSKDKTTDENAVRLRNGVCSLYLEGYIRKKHCWPPIQFCEGAEDTELYRLHSIQLLNIGPKSYKVDDWTYACFLPHQEFDYHPSYLSLIDDKTVSYPLSDISCTWRPSKVPSASKRLLEQLLTMESVDTREICRLMSTRQIPADWFVVSLYPKEREFKLAPRMFSILVFHVRMFFGLLEANLADHIMPYLPQQTMTMDAITVHRRFLKLTQTTSDEEFIRGFIEMDLSQWNLRWREKAVASVGQSIDSIFGLEGYYTVTHEYFSKCLIVVRVPELEPIGIDREYIPNSPLAWRDHLGGFEGISQKLWTICTLAMVLRYFRDQDIDVTLSGQGDNQVIAFEIPRDGSDERDQLRDFLDNATEGVAAECALVNQLVKPEECVESTTLVTYSKNFFFKGVDYKPMGKLHKMFPATSSDFPCEVSNLGAVFSSGLGAADSSVSSLKTYSLALLHGALYMYRSMRRESLTNNALWINKALLKKARETEFIVYTLSLPPELGGFPILTSSHFWYRGGADPFSKNISGFLDLCKGEVRYGHRLFGRILHQALERRRFTKTPDIKDLIADPFSAPVIKKPLPADAVAQETLGALSGKVKNVDIAPLLGETMDLYEEALIQDLAKMTPFNPVVANDIYSASLSGVRAMISRMFTATRTVQNLVRADGPSIAEHAINSANWLLLSHVQRYSELPRSTRDIPDCYTLSQSLRDLWHKG